MAAHSVLGSALPEILTGYRPQPVQLVSRIRRNGPLASATNSTAFNLDDTYRRGARIRNRSRRYRRVAARKRDAERRLAAER